MAVEGSAVCARGGDTSSRRWLQSWPRFSTTTPHGDRGRPGQGGERETNYTATQPGRCSPPGGRHNSTLPWTWMTCLPPVAPDQTVCLTCLVHVERVQRRTVQQIVDYPSLPVLDDPEPLMVANRSPLRFFRRVAHDASSSV